MNRVQGSQKGKKWWKELDIVDRINAGLFFVVLGIVPFVVRARVMTTSEDELKFVRSQKNYADFFSYEKAQIIVVIALLLLLCTGIGYFIKEKKMPFKQWLRKPTTICALVFSGLVLLSAVASPFQTVVYEGASARYEGFYMLLSYIVLFFSVQAFANTALKSRWILYCILFSAIVVGGIGAFQYFGLDFFKTNLSYQLIVPTQYQGDIPSVKVNFQAVYTTLFNPNCVGLYTALLFPLTIILGIGLPVKDKCKYVFLGVAVLLFICLIGSESEGGYIGVASAFVAFCLLCIIFGFRGKLKPTQIYGVLAGIVLLPPLLVLIVPPFRAAALGVVDRFNHQPANYYTGANANENDVTIETVNGSFSIVLEQDKLNQQENQLNIRVRDGAGNPVVGTMTQEPIPEGKEGSVPIQRLDFSVEGIGAYYLRFDGKLFILRSANEDFTLCFQRGNSQTTGAEQPDAKNIQLVDLKLNPVQENVPFVGTGKYDPFASNRGYIWSHSLPLIKQHLLLGSGPDTFSLDFPQGDLQGKLKYFGDPYIIVDKAHNIYLQTALTTGLPSLIAMLTLFGLYLCSTIRHLVHTSTQNKTVVITSVACFCSVVGFLVAGMATDSVVSVSPLFWSLLGLGFAVNEAGGIKSL